MTGAGSTRRADVTVNEIPTTVDFRAADSADGGNGSLAAVDVPAATQVGDLMLLFISNGTDRTADTPSGWTLLGGRTDDELRTQAFWRFATAGDLGSTVSSRLRDAGDRLFGPRRTPPRSRSTPASTRHLSSTSPRPQSRRRSRPE